MSHLCKSARFIVGLLVMFIGAAAVLVLIMTIVGFGLVLFGGATTPYHPAWLLLTACGAFICAVAMHALSEKILP